MDRHGMYGGGGGGPVPEFRYGGGGQPEVVVDGAFLMELLEDLPAADLPTEDVDDRLSRVIRSLEAEIGAGSTAAPAPEMHGESTTDGPASDDDGGLEDMLSTDLEVPAALTSQPPALSPFEYWAEVPAAMGHDMGGWCVDDEGYEFREHCYYNYGEGSAVEQVYSPLWD